MKIKPLRRAATSAKQSKNVKKQHKQKHGHQRHVTVHLVPSLPCYAATSRSLTLSPPAVKTQWLSQCQAFQRLVRSSHTIVNITFDLLNRFSISLACFWKHWMLFTFVCNINPLGQWKESLGQTSQSLCSSFSGRTHATSALSLGVA
jgi:hypothetical protein